MSRFDLRRALRGVRSLARRTASWARILYLRAAYPGIHIAKGTYVGPGCDISAGAGARVSLRGVTVGRGCQIIAGPGAVIDIAAESIGPNSVIVARHRIEIGAGSMLAEMVVVRDSDHARPEGAALRDGHHVSAPVVLGRDVWIGARGTVLRGVEIGDGATVGAAAVVTRDVPQSATVVGIPARPFTRV